MLEAVTKDLVFTISLKRSTQNLQLSTSWAGRLHHLLALFGPARPRRWCPVMVIERTWSGTLSPPAAPPDACPDRIARGCGKDVGWLWSTLHPCVLGLG